jgi:hypothetical protein
MEFTFENVTYTFQETIVQQGPISFPYVEIKIVKEKPTKDKSNNGSQ